MNTIFVSSHLPSNIMPEAGQKIVYSHLQQFDLSKVYVFYQYNHFEKFYISPLPTAKHEVVLNLSIPTRLLGLFFFFWFPAQVANRMSLYWIYLLRKYSRDKSVRYHFEYEQSSYFLFFLPKRHTTVVFHDVMSQQYLRKLTQSNTKLIKKLYLYIQHKLIVFFEIKLIPYIDRAVVFSNKDRDLLIDLGFAKEKILVDVPQISSSFFRAVRKDMPDRTIIFWGAMNRAENESAVIWFVDNIMPFVNTRIDDWKFIIVGANPTSRILSLCSDQITVTGFVEDPIPYLESCCLAVAPLQLGAGVKIKMLELQAARVPVVCSSVAAEGIVLTDTTIVADKIDEFASAVVRLLGAAL